MTLKDAMFYLDFAIKDENLMNTLATTWRHKMSKRLKSTALIVWFVLMLAYAVYVSYLYYFANCGQIKDFPMPMQVPNRCISL